MSLVDADKESNNRGIPSLNADDNVLKRMAHNTMGNTYRTTGLDVTQRMIYKNGLILTYDADGRVSSIYGYIPSISSTPLVIIANEGYDVFADILGVSAPTV